ncbi:MAG: serine/threonine protein kinase [Treponema sp.]|jgi:serine/threonine protein kinase|nr:serine/threonine protein kinase [Treponema sp.]
MDTQIVNEGTQVITNTTTETGANWTGGLLQAHESISGWEVIEKIPTQSGEADIYLAQKDGQKGVIKYYRSQIKPKTGILEKLKGLNHPDIVNVFEFGYYNGRFYEIMEYAAGGALDSRGEDGAYKYLPLSEEQAVEVCKEVINSYKACHEKGIIHRDIKPANLYYRNAGGGDVVIGDFGISSITDDLEKLHKTQTASRTTGYAAPEVFSGIISYKMDYYALGITLWELLTGKDPFALENGKHRNDQHLIRDTIEGRIADGILSREPRLSKPMQRLIRGLLVIDHEHRWGHDEVSRHLAGEEVPVYQKEKERWEFKIGEKSCSTLEELGSALTDNPEAARRYVYKDLLAGFLEENNPDDAKKIREIAEESSAKNDDDNGILKVAYLLNPRMPFKIGDYLTSNVDDIIFLLENAPETMLPLLRDSKSKLFTYLEILGYAEQAEEIRKLPGDCPDIDLIGKAAVILQNKIIKPFKLARYRDFELSTLEQIRRVPKDMQNHILNLVSEKSYEGNFLPWLDLLTPNVSVGEMETCGWKEFLAGIAGD